MFCFFFYSEKHNESAESSRTSESVDPVLLRSVLWKWIGVIKKWAGRNGGWISQHKILNFQVFKAANWQKKCSPTLWNLDQGRKHVCTLHDWTDISCFVFCLQWKILSKSTFHLDLEIRKYFLLYICVSSILKKKLQICDFKPEKSNFKLQTCSVQQFHICIFIFQTFFPFFGLKLLFKEKLCKVLTLI